MNRCIIAFLVLPAFLSAQQPIDGIAAVVGDNIILKSEAYQLATMSALNNQTNLNSRPDLLGQYYNLALESLILQNILLDRAKVDSMDIIPDEDVDQTLDQQIDAMLAQLGSEDRFKEVLGLSMRDFRKDHWDNIRNQIIAERYQAGKMNSVKISRDEVDEFFHTYKDSLPPVDTRYELSQLILSVRPGEAARELAYSEISGLLERINQGESFADLARQYSDDISSRELGGDLGLVRRGEFVQQFEEVAFRLEEGQISGVVETAFGYHIIQLIEKQGERIKVRHILVTAKPGSDDREKALTRIRDHFFALSESPSLFDTLIQVLSKAEKPHRDLGYIGWIEYRQLPNEAYRTALFGTKTGDITPPFETQDAFHILKVLNKKEGGMPTLEEYYPQIEALALRNKQVKYLDDWLARIRNEVFIKNLD